jgi:anti-sigma regulatory factor (Ser/Thr protein kinase)
VSEAVTNSIEHAYEFRGGAQVLLQGEVLDTGSTRAVQLTVVDEGGWKTPADSGGLRGRGMAMIEMLVDDVTVKADEHGTTVCMHRRVDCPARTDAA